MFGRFIEIGKKDIMSHKMLQMFQFARNITFTAVDIDHLRLERPLVAGKILKTVFSLVEKGVFTPSGPLLVRSIVELEKAFRTCRTEVLG